MFWWTAHGCLGSSNSATFSETLERPSHGRLVFFISARPARLPSQASLIAKHQSIRERDVHTHRQ